MWLYGGASNGSLAVVLGLSRCLCTMTKCKIFLHLVIFQLGIFFAMLYCFVCVLFSDLVLVGSILFFLLRITLSYLVIQGLLFGWEGRLLVGMMSSTCSLAH